jgi:uncharacterized membrane protein
VTRKRMMQASAILVIVMLIAALAVASPLPAGMQLPVHWNIHGAPDRFADKWIALLGPGVVTGILATFFYFLPAMEPRKAGLAQSRPLYLWGWAAALMLAVLLQVVFVLTAWGWAVPVTRIFAGAVGLMLILVGNQLGKSRSMYMVGIRTPWTLASEEVWIKTHRLGGKLAVAGGIAVIVAALAAVSNWLLFGILAMAGLIASIGPIVYSFILWRRENAG